MVLALRDRGIEVEVQALPDIEHNHIAQTLNALRATGLRVGLILNFGPKAQIKRVIYSGTDLRDLWQWAWVELNYRPHAYQACALTT